MMTLPRDLSERVKNELKAAGVPGCSLVVVNRDGAIAATAFGYASLTQVRLASSHTAYHLFSATKLYTATAIMQLVEQGKLQLTEVVADVLPEYQKALSPALTIQHLLSHTSGLKDTTKAFLAVYVTGERTPTTAEALSRYGLRAKEAPGQRVEYGNVNYALLGEIVTRRSGQPYTEYVRKHILAPLGMRVAFSLTSEMKSDAACGYVERWNPLWLLMRWLVPDVVHKVSGVRIGKWVELRDYNLSTAAIGGLVGSALEFAPFLIAHLNEGRGLLSPNGTRQMQTLVARGQAGFESKEGMGLGWKIGQVAGRPFFNHEGGGAGFTSETRLYPQEQLGFILMMNVAGVKVNRLAHRICEMIRLNFLEP